MSDRIPTEPGHNLPPPPQPLSPAAIREWLDADNAGLVTRAKELLAALFAANEAAPTIKTPEQLAAMADTVRMVKAWQRTSDERRKNAKAPFLDGGREVDSWYRAMGEALDQPLATGMKAMDRYQQVVAAAERKAAEERAARAREQAAAAAAEAAAAAVAARGIFGDEPAADEDTAAAQQKMEGAQRAAARADKAETRAAGAVAGMVRSHSDMGTVTSAREFIRFEVTDPRQVPRSFLSVDKAKIDVWLRENTATPEQKAWMRKAIDTKDQPFKGIEFRIEVKALVR